MFASALKSIEIECHQLAANRPSNRTLPNDHPSEFYELHMILASHADQRLQEYDNHAINGEFPFSHHIQTYLDDL
jgi:hypothetical protein